jgi:hypothetical protein
MGVDIDIEALSQETDKLIASARKQNRDAIIADLLALKKDLESYKSQLNRNVR